MVKTLILYESKYGFTKFIAKRLALILGPSRYCSINEFKEEYKNFEVVVICTPIYSETVNSNILKFVQENVNWLEQKKVILLCTCLAKNMSEEYLKPLKNILGKSVKLHSSICGELILNKLSKVDFDLLEKFSNSTGFPFNDYRLFNRNEFDMLALEIKKIKDIGNKIIEDKTLKVYIYDFIKGHNTCILATGYGDRVRATPIEYIFIGEHLYMLSEGGEKFANILLNPKVSIGINDPYTNMSELAGMQIRGSAEIIAIGSEEYISVLKQKNLNYENLLSLPIALNLIKIDITKVEFLWSEFTKLGYDAKQILEYSSLEG